MSEAIWFVVRKDARGLERGERVYDPKPTALIGTAYKIRIDTLPLAERWLSMSLGELMATYHRLKKNAALPAAAVPIAKAKEETKIALGHRERRAQYPHFDGEPMPAMVSGWQPRKGAPQIMPLEE